MPCQIVKSDSESARFVFYHVIALDDRHSVFSYDLSCPVCTAVQNNIDAFQILRIIHRLQTVKQTAYAFFLITRGDKNGEVIHLIGSGIYDTGFRQTDKSKKSVTDIANKDHNIDDDHDFHKCIHKNLFSLTVFL